MLKSKLYHILTLDHTDEQANVVLHFQADHAIFSGHFPGQPVVPGACLLEMVKELINEVHQTEYQLVKASNLKFIAPVDPRMSPEVVLKLTYKPIANSLQVTATLTANEVVCFKMQGIYTLPAQV